jgi:hypothetical protein
MAFQPPIELTWRNLFKASFLAIGDAALIAMIKDTPIALQTAMVVASIIGFTALVKEDWLRAKHRYAFQVILTVSGLIFVVFIAFAISHGFTARAIDYKLDDLRNRGLVLEQRPFESGLDASEFSDWKKKIDEWKKETAGYLETHIGASAKNRVQATVGHPSFNYNNASPELNHEINSLGWFNKNLQEIIDGRNRPK